MLSRSSPLQKCIRQLQLIWYCFLQKLSLSLLQSPLLLVLLPPLLRPKQLYELFYTGGEDDE
jgi:hypothetical protein